MTASIATLKAQLGLKIPSKKSRSDTDPLVITGLLEGFTKINERYADHKPPQVRASDAIRNDVNKLFETLGPTLWPDLDEEAGIPTWLSYSSGDSDEQHQTRRYYSNIFDRNL